jgi:hypothetical protein
MTLDQLTAEDFEPLLGQRLTIGLTTQVRLECELIEVRRLPSHPLRAGGPFAMTLRGPREHRFGQGMCALHHPRHGPLDVFIVPIEPDASGPRYEVTFN